MKHYVRLGFVLFIITAIACGLLAYVNAKTKPLIDANKAAVEKEAQLKVICADPANPPKDLVFTEGKADDQVYFEVKDASGQLLGYTMKVSGVGYTTTDPVRTMVGINPDFTVKRIQVIEQKETPGLGDGSLKPAFAERFNGRSIDMLAVDKDGGTIKSLTGATITTRAVTKSVRLGLEKLQKALKG